MKYTQCCRKSEYIYYTRDKFEIVGIQPQDLPKLPELLLKAMFQSHNLFLMNVNRYDNHEQRDTSRYREYR